MIISEQYHSEWGDTVTVSCKIRTTLSTCTPHNPQRMQHLARAIRPKEKKKHDIQIERKSDDPVCKQQFEDPIRRLPGQAAKFGSFNIQK